MDIKSKVVDVTSFLLFEATGDSEAGYFDPAMSINHADQDDDDDAESCSCDTTSGFLPSSVREFNSLEDKKLLANVGDDDDHHEDDEDGEVVDQKAVHLYKKCRDDQRIMAKEKKSSAVSVDSTSTVNEMEKNRLFWEACLAS
ncbi:hypothetical protein DITRI_Ditri11bG0100600 [Diplodiscus trichospermus]